MKLNSSWLATSMLLFAIFACNISNNNNSNNRPTSNRPANAEIYVDQIHMAKDDGGKPGESTTGFEPSDRTIHCVINLNKAKDGTKIRFVWIASDATGLSKNEMIKSIDYTTQGAEDFVHGHLTAPKDWPTGDYRVEVYVDGVLDKTIEYKIE